ncbi:putative phage membrane protein [Streptococcus pyogenes]|nr:putative phage membrane protein [Streptococcus pyogenes]
MTEEQMIDCLLYELVKKDKSNQKEKHHYRCTNSYADCRIRALRIA